jgi:3-deoxy-7-phosphoheptulonate synthase
VSTAIDAIRAASAGHCFLSVTKQGLSAIVETSGNDSCHVILRGGASGPNYAAEHVDACITSMDAARVMPSVMIDCSHGNSQKRHERQIIVVQDICEQLRAGQRVIVGVMIESHLVAGRQNLLPDQSPETLTYGQSITDACISWEDTVLVLDQLAEAVRARRKCTNASTISLDQ